MERAKPRRYGYDNLRVLLIACVVMGHLLELITGRAAAPVQNILYFFIYSFHIPAFIFLNGHFARFSWKRVAYFLGLYLLFQTLYLVFNRYVLDNPLEMQYEKPYWLLWYLASLLCYFLLVPVLSRIPVRFGWIPVVVSVVISLAAGYFDDVGYDYSLSRTLVFLPFFVLGHFAGRRKKWLRCFWVKKPQLWIWLGAPALAMSVLMCFVGVVKEMLYGSYSYQIGYGPVTRLLILITAGLWIGALLSLFLTKLDRKLPLVSDLGQSTLSVYLLHGFVVRFIDHQNWFPDSFLLAAVVTALLVALLGNPWASSLFTVPGKRGLQ